MEDGLLYRPRKIHLCRIVLFPPTDWRDIWIFLIMSCIEHTAISFSLPGEISVWKAGTELFLCILVHKFKTVLFLCTSAGANTELSLCLDANQWRYEKSWWKERENINKNIKHRHLLFDCCVHLYTSLHHYGLFSLQIKPKIVQITRRLKSF